MNIKNEFFKNSNIYEKRRLQYKMSNVKNLTVEYQRGNRACIFNPAVDAIVPYATVNRKKAMQVLEEQNAVLRLADNGDTPLAAVLTAINRGGVEIGGKTSCRITKDSGRVLFSKKKDGIPIVVQNSGNKKIKLDSDFVEMMKYDTSHFGWVMYNIAQNEDDKILLIEKDSCKYMDMPGIVLKRKSIKESKAIKESYKIMKSGGIVTKYCLGGIQYCSKYAQGDEIEAAKQQRERTRAGVRAATRLD